MHNDRMNEAKQTRGLGSGVIDYHFTLSQVLKLSFNHHNIGLFPESYTLFYIFTFTFSIIPE